MPATLEKPKTHTTVRQPQRRDVRRTEPSPLRRDRSSEHARVRRHSDQSAARRSTATPRRQVVDKTRVRRRNPQPVYRPKESRQPSKLRLFFRPFTLEKCFTLTGFATGLVLLVLFTIDLVFARPFMKASVAFDVTYALSGFAMILLSWSVAKDQIRGCDRVPDRIGPKLL